MTEIRFNMLEVDLTAETHRVVDVTADVKKYLGGRGLANKLIWDLVPRGADALGPENILHVGVGPLTGLLGTKTILSFKSPLTDWAGRSAVSGYFGEELIKAQYNAGILIKGRAKRPVYLYVYDETVQIRDASDIWGKWKQDTEVTLRDRLNQDTGEMFGVLCIGPAGENLVRYANATTEFVHSASKWGCGAVMGSKNLKAIAVRGTRGPVYADHTTVWSLFRKYATSSKMAGRKLGVGRWGLSASAPTLLCYAAEGIKNNHLGYHEIAKRSNHLDHYLKYYAWTDGCPGCAASCFVPFFKKNQGGAFGGEFRHDNTGGFNANVMVGYEEMTEISALLDELGMDGEELGGLVAWAMDLYEQGIITRDDLGGIDLRWGSKEAILQLMKKIAYKQDRAPAALAEGFRRAYEIFTEKSKWYAFEVHGCASPTYDVRNKIGGLGLAFGTSHNGARMGAGLRPALAEAATICIFASPQFAQIWDSEEEATRLFLNAACGWNLSLDDLNDIVLRNYYFNRCVSLREGYHPAKDDYLPPRAFEEPITDKYGTTWVWDPAEYETAKKNYYVDVLKLTDAGLPPRKGLERLGLDFVIPTLDSMGAVG
ncbi:MAG: aldehyde ferredoxin oxidoreductase N-terminal domain-containing protein [Desulfobacterales bacterium]|nr:aldehyde ferredoxin oxidoreductase N-terminal domain-containing protein [Desulfobacterales bacterium]